MRALPDVRDALRQNDPKMASYSQPVVKKAPPTSGRPMPSAFYSDAEPPRIGAPIQPPPPAVQRPAEAQGLSLPLAKTPMTPCHPPRPPIDALPKHPSMETSSCASKHPLESTTADGPPSKHVRRFHILLNIQIKSLWQHLQQLICPIRADHVQKVLQQTSCQHLHVHEERPVY